MNDHASGDRRVPVTLKLHANTLRRLRRALREAEALSASDIGSGETLALLASEARQWEAFALEASAGVPGLPGSRGVADIQVLIRQILKGGETPLSREALMGALRSQPLTQRELWAVPLALRVAISEDLCQTAGTILEDARACRRAEHWSNHPVRIRQESPVFYERALMRCGETGQVDARTLLTRSINDANLSPEYAVRLAQEARSYNRLRCENLSACRNLLNELDWLRCFEDLSEVEAELRMDPAGVYPLMDDASKQRVRDEVSRIARAAGKSELVIAAEAVSAARAAQAQPPTDPVTLSRLAAAEIDPGTTCCWWLYDDEGRRALLERLGCPRARLRRMTPDPKGRVTMTVIALLAAAVTALLSLWLRRPWLVPVCVPLAWVAANALIAWVYPKLLPPAELLKLKIDRLPDPWRTLVVVPALIPDVQHARALCDALEVHGCMESDPNLSFLLLGDFADADTRDQPGDAAILNAVRERIADMNRRAGCEKYYYLHRPRTFLQADRRWMGRDRKRGALMDLNRLLVNGENVFTAEGSAAGRLREPFGWVLTLDADTRMLPGTVHRLVGAAAHPLNRRYAVFQPRMELQPSALVNHFTRTFFAGGGVDTYPTSVSSLWMDAAGTGVYGGKGLYDPAAFHRALDGALPEGRVLSHDLIEGALAGTAFLGDVALYDGCPATPGGWARRLHRWTRGDWQLLPMLLDRRLPLNASDRFRMLDNLIRSLRASALLILSLCAAWTCDVRCLAAALALGFWDALLCPGSVDNWLRALAHLAALPLAAGQQLDAVVRTLWRLFVSGRHLLDWVPSADAERRGRRVNGYNRLAALLALPGLSHPCGIPAVLGLAALYWTGSDWLDGLSSEPVKATLSDKYKEDLTRMARDTWRFFEENVEALPPDNVQLDPPTGAARRTSPTNVGLYLLSCVSARRMGFIDADECARRMTAVLDALDRVEKWRGHLFNWIDIDALKPLNPRYVSAVDSGNLAACALACSNAVTDEALKRRLRGLAEGMDFKALYDDRRHLFHIGMDAQTGELSRSHYDLLASESRILSFTALMLGQIPMKHWTHLGRACASVGRDAALLSWSGTMFEYLMPELLMRAPGDSLLGQSARAAVKAQMTHGHPWGVSESGFHALDAQLNYQYRAFGLPALALSGDAVSGVVAPYASALALAVRPDAAADNLLYMNSLGWTGGWGFYEAADFRHPALDGSPALVRSHMAHHQGMLLCALCNALTGDSLVRDFMADSRARALSLLLEERPACRPRVSRRPTPASGARPRPDYPCRTTSSASPLGVHLLRGRDASAFVTGNGSVHLTRNGIDATRFGLDLSDRPDAARLYLRCNGEIYSFGDRCRAVYDAGSARFEAHFQGLEVRMTVSLSPEDDTLYRQIELRNPTKDGQQVEVMDLVPVALARSEDQLAHPAFQMLFVSAEPLNDDGLLFRRRSRRPGEIWPVLVHRAESPAPILRQTRLDRVISRTGDVRFGFNDDIAASPLNPVSAISTRLDVAPGETAAVCFALRLSEDEPAPSDLNARALRAVRLGRARSEAMLGFLGVSAAQYHLWDRLAALLLDPRLAARVREASPSAPSVSREDLWSLGLSGDRPLLCMAVQDAAHGSRVRELLKLHGFYHAMGLETDLAFIDEGPRGYDRPVRAMIEGQLASCPLRTSAVIVQEPSDLQREALRRASAIFLNSGEDPGHQFRTMLAQMSETPVDRPFDPGLSTLPLEKLSMYNGFGGFSEDGGYVVTAFADRLPPAPWCNLLTNDDFGLLLTERGGGFLWHGNSRSGRLTPWLGDPLWERHSLRLTLYHPETGERLSLLPGRRPAMPFHARFAPDAICYVFATETVSGRVQIFIEENTAVIDVELDLSDRNRRGWQVSLSADWLMGTDVRDARWLNVWRHGGVEYATGTMEGVGWLIPGPMSVHAGKNRLRFALGWAGSASEARDIARAFRDGRTESSPRELPALLFDTPDPVLNRMLNAFLPHQILSSRIQGRTGCYQPGGAYGFRDQLQDMLALIPTDPERVRRHLLLCAGRQFPEGDALHWWHMPYTGVRTRISDDRLFLPFVTAAYVAQTGDTAILREVVPYLESVPIPEGRDDLFQSMRPGDECGTLHDHCMRALNAADVTGAHSLALMGAGDWNDGMDRVGREGRGESVWLSMFLAACADKYAEICPTASDAEALRSMAARHRAAVEAHGWDGRWYRRAYTDGGLPLGSAECGACRIDLIAQAWAVLANLDPERSRAAVDAAWTQLVDETHGLIRLLDPPFDGIDIDPGYIRGYPPGIRENGAQYTHGACWLLLALIRLGDADRAHRALQMLLPPNRADTEEKALRYRVEPYVMAGDICALPGETGRGGWTWYTGSAAWYYVCALELMGYERRGDRVRLNALLGPWPRAAITLRYGKSRYHLVCDSDAQTITLDGNSCTEDFITLVDDGIQHEAVFPGK